MILAKVDVLVWYEYKVVCVFCVGERHHVCKNYLVDLGSEVQLSFILTCIIIICLTLRPEFSIQGGMTVSGGRSIHILPK